MFDFIWLQKALGISEPVEAEVYLEVLSEFSATLSTIIDIETSLSSAIVGEARIRAIRP